METFLLAISKHHRWLDSMQTTASITAENTERNVKNDKNRHFSAIFGTHSRKGNNNIL